MSTSKKKSTMLGMLTLGMLAASLMIGSDVYASVIQPQPPATIFSAACATCHGEKGTGGVTWVKDGPGDNRRAPNIVGLDRRYVVSKVRSGAKNGAMPAFGREEIADAELNALANWIQAGGDGSVTNGLEKAAAPGAPADEVKLYILDADPWYNDDSTDNFPSDNRRVQLATDDYLKVINTGRTWHTLTNSPKRKDSGFIGYAGNYNIKAGDLGDMGYYYADQSTGLAKGCVRYLCKMHPYMQVEVCTNGNTPAGPGAVLGLTRAHKNPLATNTSMMGKGEVWVSAQSQEDTGENTVSLDPNNAYKSVVGLDGAYQVLDATTLTAVLPVGLRNVGNNPHNAWPIDITVDGSGNVLSGEVLSANWHDNTVTLMDSGKRVVKNQKKIGATTAHAMVQPGLGERFFVTQMGGSGIHEVDLADLRLGLDSNLGGPIAGATGPHGLWYCSDGEHILTADTFGNSATWYTISTTNLGSGSSITAGSGGAAPLAPSIADGIDIFTDGDLCDRGFTNNASTADISLYNMDGDDIRGYAGWAPSPATGLYKDFASGNIKLKVTNADVRPSGSDGLTESIQQARWVHLPIQTPVSPSDSTHPRFMVTANKASFNVSVTELDSVGDPVATYTFPAGLGAHGVTYGKKATCASGPTDTCYYAYVTNTFEDYVSVYDLEKINPVDMGDPGSALLAESVYLEGGAVAAVVLLDPGVAALCGSVLSCGAGLMGATVTTYIDNLPIGVLCPDCRTGVHVADIPLTLTTGAPLAGGTPFSALTNTGAGSKYTYLKEPVWVDTMTVGCALGANDCDNTPGEGDGVPELCDTFDDDGDGLIDEFPCIGGVPDPEVGNLNLDVSAFKELDLELGINTGGQGIVGVPAATPWP